MTPLEIKTILTKGRVATSPYFNLRYLPALSHQTGLVVVLSTKTIRTAVERNKLRRQMKSIYRRYQPQFLDRWQQVIIGRSGIGKLKFAELETALINIWRRPPMIK